MANSVDKQHPWFEICHPYPTAKYQVFIFPAAGPTGSYYREWDRDFPEHEFSIIIYPGRSIRFNDKLITDLKEYIKQLDEGLLPYINKACFFIGQVGKEVLPETPLMIPIIVYIGEKEANADEEYLSKWKELTTLKSAATGIGRVTALELAKLQARIIVGIRGQERAERMAYELSKESHGNVIGHHLDLSDLASVKAFAEKINNAEVNKKRKELTKDDLESTFGTNHTYSIEWTNHQCEQHHTHSS
ncbi:unnamed protein product [Rotaria sordida]|uniref:Uncharacterized protein n=1 Tax=Rotaria sordida TaxID=392033 RepID=A0A815UCK2_9BILA|nr:unnamed protein product [Rotaria sordida]CAF1518913.1 unnamed protein product [Rotaria sordida]